jgi:Fe-S cluster assembly ATP-binding protein
MPRSPAAEMSVLKITGLRAAIAGREILKGIDLEVASGEIHAVMGPNGAGKSTLGNVVMGNPAYQVLAGSVTIDGVELLGLTTAERARAGLYLVPQDPMEIPGVSLDAVMSAALDALGRPEAAMVLSGRLASEGAEIGVAPDMLARALNVDSSGGEKKRIETLQLAILSPAIAVLDELDSGLDVDALRDVARRISRQVRPIDPNDVALGVLAITHYRRLLDELHPDMVHVLVDGRVVASGGPELADQLDQTGYGAFLDTAGAPETSLT